MTRRRVGLWLIGAFGGVGSTITLGLAALSRGLCAGTGLVTELEEFAGLPLPDPGDFVIGGHEIRKSSFTESVAELRRTSGVFDPAWVEACRSELAAASSRIRPGPHFGLSPAVARLADWSQEVPGLSAAQAVARIAADFSEFAASERLDHLIVLNVASTEPPFPLSEVHDRWDRLAAELERDRGGLLPSSSLYALAAIREGHSYINFTPSLGASLPALSELAETTGALIAGKDGKTGETLMKTVLAPMFAHRNLKVLSWVGHNIFGNRDGLILDDPTNKASKVETKDRVVSEILGYRPSSVVSIEYVPDMGDWKTAWDHIHFEGFLGTRMTLQFTWQGCDSLLAAPLAIDLARLTDLEKQRGGRGLLRHLASFFKSPEGVAENHFFRQFEALLAYAARCREN